jgi:hypothetical protein
VLLEERAERRVVEERHVGADDDDVAVEVGGQRLDGLLDGTTGAGHVVLVDDDGAGAGLDDARDDAVALVPHDRDEVLGLERRGGLEHVLDQGQARQPVQHLRGRGLHARALPCGEDDDGEAACGHGSPR